MANPSLILPGLTSKYEVVHGNIDQEESRERPLGDARLSTPMSLNFFLFTLHQPSNRATPSSNRFAPLLVTVVALGVAFFRLLSNITGLIQLSCHVSIRPACDYRGPKL